MTKETVAAAIKEMPQEFDLDALFEKLGLIEEIEAARKEVREGNTISLDEVEKIAMGWTK
jgi:hypothetical protein